MGSLSIWHWLIVLLVVVLLFGAGKIPRLMGDVAKGVKAFKKGMREEIGDDDAVEKTPSQSQRLDSQSGKTVESSAQLKDVVKD